MNSAAAAMAVKLLRGKEADPEAAKYDHLHSIVEEHGAAIAALQVSLNAVRSTQNALEREFPDVVRQLDILAGQVEREKGDVAVLKEQLAFLVQGGERSRMAQTTQNREGKGLLHVVVGFVRYLYDPFLYFVQGCVILLAPVLMTIRSLSVLRSRRSAKGDSGDLDADRDAVYDVSFDAPNATPSALLSSIVVQSSEDKPVGRRQSAKPQLPPDPARPTPTRGAELFALLQSTSRIPKPAKKSD